MDKDTFIRKAMELCEMAHDVSLLEHPVYCQGVYASSNRLDYIVIEHTWMGYRACILDPPKYRRVGEYFESGGFFDNEEYAIESLMGILRANIEGRIIRAKP